MMPWMIPLIGAIGGGLMNKKKPLQGALMGGLLGGAGGGFLGASGGLGAAANPMSQAGMLASQEAGLGLTGGLGWGGATTGLQGAMNSAGGLLGAAKQYAGPAMNVAQSVKAMTPEEQPIQASPLSPAVPNPGPSNFYNSIIEQQNQRQMAELEKRYRRRAGNGIA